MGRGLLSQGQIFRLVLSRLKRVTYKIHKLTSEDLPLFKVLATLCSKQKVRVQGIIYTRGRELVEDAFREPTNVSKVIELN